MLLNVSKLSLHVNSATGRKEPIPAIYDRTPSLRRNYNLAPYPSLHVLRFQSETDAKTTCSTGSFTPTLILEANFVIKFTLAT